MRDARLLIDGEWHDGAEQTAVLDKYRHEPVANVARATPDDVVRAVDAARRAQARGSVHPFERFEVLATAAELVAQRRTAFVETMIAEAGFTTEDAATEVDRAIVTLRTSGEEAKRIHGEMVPLDAAPGVRGRLGFTLRRPVGVVGAITPFNSPLNTVAHKVGPALAAGNSVVLKPAELTPVSTDLLAEALLDAGLGAGLLNVVHGPGTVVGRALIEHDGVDFFTFTGSTEVGRAIKRAAGLRRTQLELGSISCTIVSDDADLDLVVQRTAPASFRKAGQVCTSVQRLYVDAQVADELRERLVAETRGWRCGDPSNPATRVGPLISLGEAERVASWIAEATERGASVALGGTRDGAVVAATVLTGVDPTSRVMCEEVFGPVVSIVPFTSLAAVVDEINAGEYGLAVGIFTRDLSRALASATRLRVGSVHVNDTSSSRVDPMPYGGLKASGHGKEGPKYAIREMTEETLVTLRYDPDAAQEAP